jgi:hypothetical protein
MSSPTNDVIAGLVPAISMAVARPFSDARHAPPLRFGTHYALTIEITGTSPVMTA